MKPTKEYLREKYFPLPNQIFSLGLTAEEFAIYSYLMYLEDRKTCQCHPAYKTIGRTLHMSENTVRKYVRRLVDKGFIYTDPTRVQRSNGLMYNGNLRYTIRPIQEVIEYTQEQQLAALDAARAQQQVEQRIEDYNRKHPERPVTVMDSSQPKAVGTP